MRKHKNDRLDVYSFSMHDCDTCRMSVHILFINDRSGMYRASFNGNKISYFPMCFNAIFM